MNTGEIRRAIRHPKQRELEMNSDRLWKTIFTNPFSVKFWTDIKAFRPISMAASAKKLIIIALYFFGAMNLLMYLFCNWP